MKYRIFVNGEERSLTKEEKRKITDKIAEGMGYKRKEEQNNDKE